MWAISVLSRGRCLKKGLGVMPRAEAQVLTAEEAARYLRLHVKSVYRLAKRGKIPAQKAGGRWRFHSDALERWLKNEKAIS